MATKKKFDAVSESRRWRTATGKKLSAMSANDRLAYLNGDVSEKLQALRGKPSRTKAKRRTNSSRERVVHS